jgi:hypothetical protein
VRTGNSPVVDGIESASGRKRIDQCIYCPNPPDGREHWLNRSLGTFHGNTLLTDRICTPCNVELGGTIDLELLRSGHTGMTRQVLGIGGRPGHEKKNVFEYRASQLEPPVQVFHQQNGDWQPVLEQAIAKNPDGTLRAIQARALTIDTEAGKQTMPFPRGWGEKQLRAAAEARGLLGGKLVSAHVPPPETVEEFVAASRDMLRAVFGPFEMDVYRTRFDGEVGPVEQTLVRFNLSPAFLRAVAKVSFHYFLWACPHIGGDEPEFEKIRSFVRRGLGEPSDFLSMNDSLVDRIPAEQGPGSDCHAFAAFCLDAGVIVQAHFFSQAVGPAFPTFVIRLGERPESLVKSWRRVHVAAYSDEFLGHDGVLRELKFT